MTLPSQARFQEACHSGYKLVINCSEASVRPKKNGKHDGSNTKTWYTRLHAAQNAKAPCYQAPAPAMLSKVRSDTLWKSEQIIQALYHSSSPPTGRAVSLRILSLSSSILNSSFKASRSSSLFLAPLRSNSLASLSAFNLRSSSLSR